MFVISIKIIKDYLEELVSVTLLQIDARNIDSSPCVIMKAISNFPLQE
jgi:hypothetical protein